MKPLPIFTFLFGALLFVANPVMAQDWQQLGPLLELFDQDQRDTYEIELEELLDRVRFRSDDGLNFNDLGPGSSLDSLLSHLGGRDIDAPDSLIEVWAGNRDALDQLLDTDLFSTEDSLSMVDQFELVNGEWYNELDSLGNVISMGFPDIDEALLESGRGRFDVSGGPAGFSLTRLRNTSRDFRDGVPVQGLDSITEVLDTTLFAGNMDIEIGFGQEFSKMTFYQEGYTAQSSLIRVASVPTYREVFSYRWALEGSFFTVSDDITFESGSNLEDGLNPFICTANVAMMYLPRFGRLANGAEFRLYTSVGLDLNAYVPPHVRADDPRTLDNTGNTTGYGPEVALGFVVNAGSMSMYSYGAIATGEVIGAPADYRFNAATMNAGLRIGDAITARYTLGTASWAPRDRKLANFSRFTVGVILDSLNR